jgi:hypothetical protein
VLRADDALNFGIGEEMTDKKDLPYGATPGMIGQPSVEVGSRWSDSDRELRDKALAMGIKVNPNEGVRLADRASARELPAGAVVGPIKGPMDPSVVNGD